MRDFQQDGPLTDEFGDEWPKEIRWHGSTVEVTARLIPRFLWTTASIEVFLDEECILRTGGQLKITGSSSAEFCHGGSVHHVELSWGQAHLHSFPYELRIDGAKVAVSQVFVQNWKLILLAWWIPVALVLILMALLG
jgi:hypothetical protein